MKETARKRMQLATGALLIILGVIMYMTHRALPFMMDDLWYSTMLSSEEPVSSLGDVIAAQIWHYHNWGGRSMTHGLLQLILIAGERVADLLNVAVTFLLAWMICLTAEERRLPVFFAAAALPLGLNANWMMSMFWQSGAANYLYITVFILGFLFCYLRELPESAECGAGKPAPGGGEQSGRAECGTGQVKSLPGIALWIIPLGILAGWSNENMGPTAWILSLIVMCALKKYGRKVRPWMILGNICCLFGSIMMIAAPGNFVRSAETKDGKGLLWQAYLRCYSEAKGAMEYLFPTLLALALVLVLARCVGVAVNLRNRLLLLGALLSWGAMILSPHYPDRASFGTMTLLICVILSLAGKAVERRKELAWPLWWAVVLIWCRGMYFCCERLGLIWGWIV